MQHLVKTNAQTLPVMEQPARLAEPLSRRKFFLSAGALAAVAAGASACTTAPPAVTPAPPPPESIARIGNAYITYVPTEADAAVLASLLTPTIDPNSDLAAQLGAAGPAVSEDFAADRRVTLRGWILSQTEARICALAVLRAQL